MFNDDLENKRLEVACSRTKKVSLKENQPCNTFLPPKHLHSGIMHQTASVGGTMDQAAKAKVEIERSLRPYFEMLESKRLNMTISEWNQLVERMTNSICQNPDQYLEREIIIDQHTDNLIREVFNNFITKLDA